MYNPPPPLIGQGSVFAALVCLCDLSLWRYHPPEPGAKHLLFYKHNCTVLGVPGNRNSKWIKPQKKCRAFMRGKFQVNLTASEAALFLVGFLLEGGQHLLIQPHVPLPPPLLDSWPGNTEIFSFQKWSNTLLRRTELQIQTTCGFQIYSTFFSFQFSSEFHFPKYFRRHQICFRFFVTVPSYHNDITLRSFHLKSEVIPCCACCLMCYQRIVR